VIVSCLILCQPSLYHVDQPALRDKANKSSISSDSSRVALRDVCRYRKSSICFRQGANASIELQACAVRVQHHSENHLNKVEAERKTLSDALGWGYCNGKDR